MKDFSGSPVDRNDVGDRMNGTDSDKGEAALLCDVNTRHERWSAGYIPQNIIDTDSDWPSETGADGVTGSSVAATPSASPVFFHYPTLSVGGMRSLRPLQKQFPQRGRRSRIIVKAVNNG